MIVLLPLFAAAQTTFHDPQGRYDLKTPVGWQVIPDSDLDQITVKDGAVQATIFVSQQNKTNAMTGKEFVDSTAKEFKGQCPTFQVRQSGVVQIVGVPGNYTLFTCSDPKSPSVAETSAVLTGSKVLVGFTLIAPLSRYYASLPLLDGMRDSLHLTGTVPNSPAPQGTDSLAMIEVKKACVVGAFSAQDCARRIAILLGQENSSATSSQVESTGTEYRDPQDRFSLRVPKGWTPIPEGENGSLGVQLRSGSNWINVIPAQGAANSDEVVLHQEQAIALRSKSDRKPPFGAAGLMQLFGHGVTVSYDHFAGVSPNGDAVESYIGGVGNISGSGHQFLLIVASIGKTSAGGEQSVEDGGAIFLATAQSVHLTAN
jgi:hypothetical protein